jgi:hypothetical protein
MKKLGIIIFIIAILVGIAFSNLFSFGKASAGIFHFSIGSSIEGSGVSATEVREVSGFKGVDVGGVFQVEITAGKDYAVEVEADDNLLPNIKTEIEGGVLKISTEGRLKSSSPMRIRISAPDIESIEASGACKIAAAEIKNAELRIDTSGASKVKLTGETAKLAIDVSGASNIDASSLKTIDADVDASGASSVDVLVSGKLMSEASGASRISYSGNPSSVEKNTSGASRVSQK